MRKFRRLVEELDRTEARKLLWINALGALFVLIGHGAAFVAPLFGEFESAEEFRPVASISVPLSLAVLITSAAAWLRPHWADTTLKGHTIVFLVGLVWVLTWTTSILTYGIPKQTVLFRWDAVLFLYICAYPVYLLRITFLWDYLDRSVVLKYSHVGVAILSLIISAIIWTKLFEMRH